MAYRAKSSRIGYLIAEEHPDIANEYMDGCGQERLAKKYNVRRQYDLPSLKSAAEAVGYALRQLMTMEQYQAYVKDHRLRAQEKSGSKARKKKTGIFSNKWKKKDRQRTGREGAQKAMKEKKGIFHPGYERTNKMQTLARGVVEWTTEMKDYFLKLCGNSKFRHNYRNQHNGSDSPGMRVPDYNKIAEELGKKFGIKVKPEDLRSNRYRFVKAEKEAEAARVAASSPIDIDSQPQPYGSSAEIVTEIRQEHGPEIVKRYRAGETQMDITDDMHFPQIYGVGRITARRYVSAVVQELIGPGERKILKRSHKNSTKSQARKEALMEVRAREYFFQIRTWRAYQKDGEPDLKSISGEMEMKFPGMKWPPRLLKKILEAAKEARKK